MPDPNSPNRPDHPDFWLMSQAVVDADLAADHGQEVSDIAGQVVDVDSLRYMAEQRAIRILGGAGDARQQPRTFIKMAALWMDAFNAGTRFQHLKASQAQQFSAADEFRARGVSGDQ